jgi:Putative zinc-finger
MEHQRAVENLAVEAYLLGEMTPAEREAFEEHYFECSVCADDLRSASRFVTEMKDVLAAGRRQPAASQKPGRSTASWTWLAWLQPQIAAAAIAILLVVAGVESLSLRRQIEDVSAPRILRPQVLRPQTRGTPAILNVPMGEPALLNLDLPDFPASSASAGMRFLLKSNDGRTVLEIDGAAIQPGEPVTLSIPRLDLPAGRYDLVVEAASGQNGQELARYPFQLKRP